MKESFLPRACNKTQGTKNVAGAVDFRPGVNGQARLSSGGLRKGCCRSELSG